MSDVVIASNQTLKVEPITIYQSFPSTVITGNYQLVVTAGTTSYIEISKLKAFAVGGLQITIAPTASASKYVVKTYFNTTTEYLAWNTANKLIIPCGCSLWVDAASAGSAIEIYGTRFINSP